MHQYDTLIPVLAYYNINNIKIKTIQFILGNLPFSLKAIGITRQLG